MPQPPNRWSPEEDELLRKEVLVQLSQGGVRDWQNIAAKLPDRTNKDCRKRWHNVVAGGMNKGHWTDAEDKLLIDAVNTYGKSWTVVADVVKSRNAEQCSKRWKQSLDPQLNRSQWTEEENKVLLEAHKTKGSQWKEIQVEYFPNRSRNAIKNQFTILCRRRRNNTRANNKMEDAEQVSDESDAAPNEADGGSQSDDDLNDSDPIFDMLMSGDDQDSGGAYQPPTWSLDPGINDHNVSPNNPPELPPTIKNSSISSSTLSNIAPTQQSSADMTSWINLENIFANNPHTLSDNQIASYSFDSLPGDMMDFSASSATQENVLSSDLPSITRPMSGSMQQCPPPTTTLTDYDNDPEKVTLTIYKPNSDTVEGLTRIAMSNRSGFRLERN